MSPSPAIITFQKDVTLAVSHKMWTIILHLPLIAYIFISIFPLHCRQLVGPIHMVEFSTEQPDLLVHGASLDIVTEYYLQSLSLSLFGDENDDFIQLKAVSPGIYLHQQAVRIMAADPSTLQEASPWMNLLLWIGNFPSLAWKASIRDSLSCWKFSKEWN